MVKRGCKDSLKKSCKTKKSGKIEHNAGETDQLLGVFVFVCSVLWFSGSDSVNFYVILQFKIYK